MVKKEGSKQAYAEHSKRSERIQAEIKSAAKFGIVFNGPVPMGENFRTARSERTIFETGGEGARAALLAPRNDRDVLAAVGQNLADLSGIEAAFPGLTDLESLKCSIEADLSRISPETLDRLTPALDAKLDLLARDRAGMAIAANLRSRLSGQIFKGVTFKDARGKPGGAVKGN